jgi:alpha-L-fucosidase 2
MGHGGVLRVFGVWPKQRNARFGSIRAAGAFLVWGELKDGKVQPITIVSERGRDCTLASPWPGKTVALVRSGRAAETLAGKRLTFKTRPGERIRIRPAN